MAVHRQGHVRPCRHPARERPPPSHTHTNTLFLTFLNLGPPVPAPREGRSTAQGERGGNGRERTPSPKGARAKRTSLLPCPFFAQTNRQEVARANKLRQKQLNQLKTLRRIRSETEEKERVNRSTDRLQRYLRRFLKGFLIGWGGKTAFMVLPALLKSRASLSKLKQARTHPPLAFDRPPHPPFFPRNPTRAQPHALLLPVDNREGV